jgi:hypothetical protein
VIALDARDASLAVSLAHLGVALFQIARVPRERFLDGPGLVAVVRFEEAANELAAGRIAFHQNPLPSLLTHASRQL